MIRTWFGEQHGDVGQPNSGREFVHRRYFRPCWVTYRWIYRCHALGRGRRVQARGATAQRLGLDSEASTEIISNEGGASSAAGFTRESAGSLGSWPLPAAKPTKQSFADAAVSPWSPATCGGNDLDLAVVTHSPPSWSFRYCQPGREEPFTI